MHGVYANQESIEGTSTGSEETFTLARKSRKIIITNDHASNALSFKFNDSEDFATLKATESVSMYFTAKQIIINGSSVPYRIWVHS